tara:strand:- start:501 stop:839 length:339 start_codon:yes stop_codon:yes gene_type:complete
MAKKITKASTKRKVNKKTVKRKQNQLNKNENSMGIMMLVIVGLFLLIYFASNVNVNVETDISIGEESSEEMIDKSIIISGKTYSSKAEARKQLKFMPQSQLTDEEIRFVEGY